MRTRNAHRGYWSLDVVPAARRALRTLIASQRPRGEWDSGFGAAADVRVTGWSWVALGTADRTDLPVPDDTMELACAWMRRRELNRNVEPRDRASVG